MESTREGIVLAKRSLASDVVVDPRVGERREIRTRRVPIEPLAPDAGPRREVVRLAHGRRRDPDEMQTGELASNPGPGIVLIGDRVNAELRDDRVELVW